MDGLIEWYLTALRRYAQFDGRSRRREYWSFVVVNWVIPVVAALVAGLLGRILGGLIGALVGLYALATIIPHLAVTVRRLHDTGRSGWWFFITFVPLIGWIWLIVLMLLDSEPGDNQYGPNPKRSLAYA